MYYLMVLVLDYVIKYKFQVYSIPSAYVHMI